MLCDIPGDTFALIGLGVAPPPRRAGDLRVWVDLRDGSVWRRQRGWVNMTSADGPGFAIVCLPDALVRLEVLAHPGLSGGVIDAASGESNLPFDVLERVNRILTAWGDRPT